MEPAEKLAAALVAEGRRDLEDAARRYRRRLMTPEPAIDAAFHAALEGRPPEWVLRAIAGHTMREFCETNAETEQANSHGLARAWTDDERAAWTFGFTWVDRVPEPA
jgi:hypothetical protein